MERILDQFGAWHGRRVDWGRTGRLLKPCSPDDSRSENGEPKKVGAPGELEKGSWLALTKSRFLTPLNSSTWPGPATGSGMTTISTWGRSRSVLASVEEGIGVCRDGM